MANALAGALVANTPASVTVTASQYGIWVENRTAATEIWVRLDGTAATVAGNDCYLVTGARNFPTPFGGKDVNVAVSLISSSTPSYAVSGVVPVNLVA